MTARRDRHREFQSTIPTWWVIFVLLLLLSFFLISVDRYLEWDEAVFYSQSGGHEGSGARPLPMAPSREFGPAALIAGLRATGLDLPEVRIAWMVLTVGLIALTFRRIANHFGQQASVVAALACGTFWLSLVYSASFYGSLLAGLFGLLAASAYLDLRYDAPHPFRSAGLLGLALAGAFAMRQIESLLILAILLIHSLVVSPVAFWRRSYKAVAMAATVFTLLFILPWTIYSSLVYGSVRERFVALDNQVARNPDIEFVFGLRDYLGVLVGDLQQNGLFTPIPVWPRYLMLAVSVLAAALLAGILARIRHFDELRPARPIGLITCLAVTPFMFFAFVYASVEVRDRYMTTVAVFAAVVVGWLWERSSELLATRRHVSVTLATFVAVVWITAQLALAAPYESNRDLAGEATLRAANTMRVLAGSEPCYAVARFGLPEIQVASGCTVQRMVTQEDAERWAREIQSWNEPAFILWPGGPEALTLGSSWVALETPLGLQPRTLFALIDRN